MSLRPPPVRLVRRILGTVGALCVALTAASGQDRVLIRPSARSQAADQVAADRVVVAPRWLMRGATAEDSTFVVALPDGSAYRGVVEHTRIDRADRFVSKGKLVGQPFGEFLFLVEGERVTGLLAPHPGRRYGVMPTAERGVHRVTLQRGADLPPGGQRRPDPAVLGEMALTGPAATPPTAVDVQPTGGLPPIIDVLFCFTPRASVVLGGDSIAISRAQLAIELANDAYDSSLAFQHLRFAAAKRIEYGETGDANTDLERFTRPADGFMDEVAQWRLDYHADLVCLLVANSDMSDLGWLNDFQTFNATWTYCLARIEFIDSDVVTRALGTIQGLNHDFMPNTPAVFPFAFGYSFVGASNQPWATIMSNGSTRIRRHSNPTVFWDGRATGTPINSPTPAYAAQSLTLTAPTIAQIADGGVVAPPVISSPTTASGVVDQYFEYQITAANGPTSFGAAGLPLGLSVNTQNGLISGIPRQPGVYSVDLSASNMGGTGVKVLTLTIDSVGDCPVVRVARRLQSLGVIPKNLLGKAEERVPDVCRRFRDQVLQTDPEGRQLIVEYYGRREELTRLLYQNPELLRDAASVLVETLPALEAARPDAPLQLTDEQLAAVERLLDAAKHAAGDDLDEVLESSRRWLKSHTRVGENADAAQSLANRKPADGR